MKIAILLLLTAIVIGCSQETPHIRELKKKIADVGAQNLVTDAISLSAQYPGDKKDYQIYWEMMPTNSLSVFGRPARVDKTSVSITTAGLGSFRAGVLINTSVEEQIHGSNTLKLAENIWFWTERR